MSAEREGKIGQSMHREWKPAYVRRMVDVSCMFLTIRDCVENTPTPPYENNVVSRILFGERFSNQNIELGCGLLQIPLYCSIFAGLSICIFWRL
jgi:hypothetical protein